MQVRYLHIRSTLQVQYLQTRSMLQVPSQMSVGAGWPCLWVLAFCAWCWHAIQKRRKKRKSKIILLAVAHFYLDSQPSSDSSITKVVILKTTGSPQGTGFPSTSGQKSGTFGPTLRGALRRLGKLLETLTV